jgi:hypothetical protein
MILQFYFLIQNTFAPDIFYTTTLKIKEIAVTERLKTINPLRPCEARPGWLAGALCLY